METLIIIIFAVIIIAQANTEEKLKRQLKLEKDYSEALKYRLRLVDKNEQ